MTFKKNLALIAAFPVLASANALTKNFTAPLVQATCFEVEGGSSDDPSRMPGDVMVYRSTSTWCVKSLADNAGVLIFKKDGVDLSPGTSFVLKVDANGKKTLTETYMIHGQTGVSATDPDVFNPLPFDLDRIRPENLLLQQGFKQTTVQREFFASPRSRGLLDQLAHGARNVFKLKFNEPQDFDLTDDKLPYRGYWWPHERLELASGPTSPLGKYDAFIEARTGRDPLSREWEIKYHSLETVPWGGHCNGWVASSILYPEPTDALWDTSTQTAFLVSDLKGVMTEASFCVDWAFYGTRYDGKPGQDMKDISPDRFHKVLTYYLQEQKKPVAMDYFPDEKVDNNIVTGVHFDYTADPTTPNQVHVVATLRMHKYDMHRQERLGHADEYQRVYQYQLSVDPVSGDITGGTWLSDNPDFLWVPLAQSDCGRENHQIKGAWVNEMLKLPKATVSQHDLGVELHQVLQPGEQVVVFGGELRGFLQKITLSNNTIQDSGLYLSLDMMPTYPDKDNYLPTTQSFSVYGQTEIPISPMAENVSSIKLINYSSQPIDLEGLRFEHLEALGGP